MKMEFEDPKLGKLSWEFPPDMVEGVELLKTRLRKRQIPEESIAESERKHLGNLSNPIKGVMSLIAATQCLEPDLQVACLNLMQERLVYIIEEVRTMIDTEGDDVSGGA